MKTQNPRKSLNHYARYSGMAFQMLAIILIGVFGGYKMDQWLEIKPVLTVILSIVSVFMAIYLSTKEFLRNKKD